MGLSGSCTPVPEPSPQPPGGAAFLLLLLHSGPGVLSTWVGGELQRPPRCARHGGQEGRVPAPQGPVSPLSPPPEPLKAFGLWVGAPWWRGLLGGGGAPRSSGPSTSDAGASEKVLSAGGVCKLTGRPCEPTHVGPAKHGLTSHPPTLAGTRSPRPRPRARPPTAGEQPLRPWAPLAPRPPGDGRSSYASLPTNTFFITVEVPATV